MIVLTLSVLTFNFLAFTTNKRLTSKQIAHVFVFTIAFQMSVDTFLDVKYHAYWYFHKGVDWLALPAHTILIPPVNMMFLNWFPFKSSLWRRLLFLLCWITGILLFELTTMLPAPWGFFHYGRWWNLGLSGVLNFLILSSLLVYYKKFIA